MWIETVASRTHEISQYGVVRYHTNGLQVAAGAWTARMNESEAEMSYWFTLRIAFVFIFTTRTLIAGVMWLRSGDPGYDCAPGPPRSHAHSVPQCAAHV